MECAIPAGCGSFERASKCADNARLGGLHDGSGDAFHDDFPVCGSKRPDIHIATRTALTYVRQCRQHAVRHTRVKIRLRRREKYVARSESSGIVGSAWNPSRSGIGVHCGDAGEEMQYSGIKFVVVDTPPEPRTEPAHRRAVSRQHAPRRKPSLTYALLTRTLGGPPMTRHA